MARRYAFLVYCTLMLSVLLGLMAVPSIALFAAPKPEAAQSAAPQADNADVKTQTQQTPDKSAEAAGSDNGLSVKRNESEIILRGSVPSEEDRQTALGMVKAHFPGLAIQDKVAVAQLDVQRDQWLAAVSFSLQQLANMSKGKVRFADGGLTLTGQAANAEDFGEIKKALSGTLPEGLVLNQVEVRPPVADPFVFEADLGPNALSLAGSVPSENARKSVRDLSRQLFARPGLDDRLEVASGAPKNWDQAVAAALRALSRLETGKVALNGVAVSIEGVAPDQGTAVAVSSQLRRDLPKRFSTSESIKWKEAVAPVHLLPERLSTQDFAATIIPRIKESPKVQTRWRSGALPPLVPLSAGH